VKHIRQYAVVSVRSLTLSAALFSLGASSVLAQIPRGPNGLYRSGYPRSGYPQHSQAVPDGSYLRVLPPEHLQPMTPGSLLIEQGFRYMRATSPNPNTFMYGRWNPRVEVVTPPPAYYVPPVYPYPYPYGGGGYGYPYGGYPPVVLQQEVIILQDRMAEINRNAGRGQLPAGRSQAPGSEVRGGRREAGEGIRPTRAANESLSDALDDIRKAWLNGDFERLKARIKSEGDVRIYLKGEYKYSIPGKDFAAALKDAMTHIDTTAFELDRPRSEEAGRVTVTGKHTFLDATKQKQETYISYTLERVSGRWKIIEAGSSSTPLLKQDSKQE
jgi:hypothetical protein